MLKASNFLSKAEVINKFKKLPETSRGPSGRDTIKRTNGWKEFNKHSPSENTPQTDKRNKRNPRCFTPK